MKILEAAAVAQGQGRQTGPEDLQATTSSSFVSDVVGLEQFGFWMLDVGSATDVNLKSAPDTSQIRNRFRHVTIMSLVECVWN